MYTRQEAAQLRQEFWTTFGQYMMPVLSADGLRVNWINYKTGERNLLFRMDADADNTSISIEISHKDEGIRLLYFEQMVQLQQIFHITMGEEWNWKAQVLGENGKTISRISRQQEGFSIFKKEDWPGIISFLKPRIIALDEFWSTARHVFDSLK